MKHKECFLDDDSCGPMNKETGKPTIKEAHILSRAATMQQLAGIVNGQREVFRASSGKSEGWKKASAYHCFCGIHDDKIFNPIENDNEFDSKDLEQLFLHSFRSFAYEYHQKRIEMDSNYYLVKEFADILDGITKIFNDEQIQENNYTSDLDQRYSDHMYAHDRIKTGLLEAYFNKRYDDLHYKSYVINRKFSFASAGTLLADIVSLEEFSTVHYDPSESQLARPGIMLTVFPDCHKNRTNIILACLKKDQNGAFYLNKFDNMNFKSICLAISSLMLTTNRNNTFFHPVYWKALQNLSNVDLFNKELNKSRGFDLLAKSVQLSEFNLFDPNLTSEKLNILDA